MSSRVATTQWSQILAARDGSATEARAALEFLCQTYWQPVYAYIRRQGTKPEEAGDLTQAYFTELLEKDFLSSVDPQKGRFRAFLFASLRHFLSHEWERERALKRGGGVSVVSLNVDDAEKALAIPSDREMGPEEAFEYRWAMTVLERAMSRLRADSAAAGTLNQFDRLRPYLTDADPTAAYRQTAMDLGITETAVKSAVQRLRKRLGQSLRSEIAATVADPADIDEEVRHLLQRVRV